MVVVCRCGQPLYMGDKERRATVLLHRDDEAFREELTAALTEFLSFCAQCRRKEWLWKQFGPEAVVDASDREVIEDLLVMYRDSRPGREALPEMWRAPSREAPQELEVLALPPEEVRASVFDVPPALPPED